MNKDKINQSINSIPICEDGKKAVRKLVEEITGESLAEKKVPQLGARFKNESDFNHEYVLANGSTSTIAMINPQSGTRWSNEVRVKDIWHITQEEFDKTKSLGRFVPL